MTRFEELQAIIERNKNKKNTPSKLDEVNSLEVPGLTESDSKNPLIVFATEAQDMDLVDQLYAKPKHRPLDGSGASYWDQE